MDFMTSLPYWGIIIVVIINAIIVLRSNIHVEDRDDEAQPH